MNRKEIQELRELVEAGRKRVWTVAEKAEVLIALRACADREERAQAGITDEVVDDFVDYLESQAWLRIDTDHKADIRHALQSAALALQGDREKLRALIQEARDAEFFEDGLSADLHCADITTLPDAYIEGRLNVLDDLSRAIGDEK